MKITASFILTLIGFLVFAQHTPINTQYMYHGLLVNPAITGSKGNMVTSFSYRNQWIGNEFTPSTALFSIHAPLKNEKVSVGFQVYDDKVLYSRSTGIGGYFAYRISKEEQSLSFGLKLGVYQRNTNWSDVSTIDGNDPSFNQSGRTLLLGAGAGVYYRNNEFYFGVSSPELLGGSSVGLDVKEMNFMLISGYLFSLSQKVGVIPNLLIRKAGFGRFQTDFTLLFRINNKFDLGAIYRSKQVLGASLDYRVWFNLQLGYTFDVGYGKLNPKGSFGNHEVSVSYEFKKIVNAEDSKFF